MPALRSQGGFNTTTFAREPAPQEPAVRESAPAQAVQAPRPRATTAIPLGSIVERLPENLKRLLGEVVVEGVKAHIPSTLIQSQIATGVVRLSFGELRQYVPPGTFVAGKNLDQALVELPLQEIITRIDPALLPRRTGQRQTVVPVDIAGPFASEEQLRAVKIVQKPAAPAPETAPALQHGRDAFAEIYNTPTKETPAAPGHVPMPVLKAEDLFIRKSPASVPAPEIDVFQRAQPSPANGHPAIQMKVPLENEIAAGQNFSAPQDSPPKPQPERMRVQFRPAAATHAPEPVAEDKGTITVALADLCVGWPETLKQEIVMQHLSGSVVPLPLAVVEVGMKQGSVSLPWRIIRSWLKPAALLPQSVHDPMVVDLPLKVITPLFLAALKGSRPKSRVVADPEIPNVFMRASEPETSEPVFTPTPPPAAAAPVSPAVDPAPATIQLLQAGHSAATRSAGGTSYFNRPGAEEEVKAPPLRANGSVGTEFLKKHASPAEIVKKAMTLPNVEGVLITLPDGLLIAGQVPPTINADTMAGFVPQIYGRVLQCSKELRMGELNNLSFTVGQIPWRIFKVSAIYFAAFGSAGVSLPTAELAQLASELNRNPS
jgi:hypothetical protein